VTNHSTLGKNYTYDQNGNMLTRGNQTLPWTVDNRVASVSISGGGTTSMEYDYSGMWVKKTAPAGITLYPFAGYEIDPNGVITKFIRAGGESIASKKGTAKYFYHNDHLGSVNVVTDITGMRVQLNQYDPWGLGRGVAGFGQYRSGHPVHRTEARPGDRAVFLQRPLLGCGDRTVCISRSVRPDALRSAESESL
jgi:uncharacterized protein RhaS with RHS repeats